MAKWVSQQNSVASSHQISFSKRWNLSPLFWMAMIAILLLLIGLPTFWLIVLSFSQPQRGLTISNYVQVFCDPHLIVATVNSLVLATGVGIFSVVIGVPMAWAVARTNMPCRKLIQVLLLTAFTTPPFLGGIAWILLAAPNSGWLNRVFINLTGAGQGPFNVFTLWGAIFVVSIYSYPYVFLLVSSVLELIPSELEDGASVLGASSFTTTMQIVLPLCLPSIISGFLLSFLEAITLFGSPTLILIPARVDIITTEIWQQFQDPPNIELASAFSLSLLAIAVVLLWGQRQLLANKGYTTLSGKGGSYRLLDIGHWRWFFLAFCLFISSVSVFLPFYILLRASLSQAWGKPFTVNNLTLKWYEDVLFRLPQTQLSIQNSLLYSLASAVFAMAVGISISYILKHKSTRIWQILGFLPMIPLAIPGIVIAVGIFAAYSRPPLVLYGTALIMIVAYTTRFLPVAFSNASAIFKSIEPELELAARNLGATQLVTLSQITLPLVKRGLIGGLFLVFILSIRELSCAILLFTPNTEVMTTVLFDLVNEVSYERLAALGVIMLLIVFGTVGLAYKLLGQNFMLGRK